MIWRMALTYDIAKELLYGTVGKEKFHLKAYSGGGRGKAAGYGPGESSLRSHLSTTKEDEDAGIRGGPIPPGDYRCVYLAHHHPFKGAVIQLSPQHSARAIHTVFASMPIVHHRGGFYIHGRGELGSDGCIVPEIPTERIRLNNAVKKEHGTVLKVINASYMLPAEAGGVTV
jgi:hypothetical protein